VPLDDRFDNGQTKSSPVMLSAECTVDLHEGFKHDAEVLRLNANPSVDHSYGQPCVRIKVSNNIDASARVREFHCVAKKVQEYLLRLAFIGPEHRQVDRNRNRNDEAGVLPRRQLRCAAWPSPNAGVIEARCMQGNVRATVAERKSIGAPSSHLL
jgi:hypothetical protein